MSAIQSFKDEHVALLEHVEHLRETAARVPELDTEGRRADLRRVIGFLRNTLIPHAEAEEAVLYPAVAEILGNPDSTATMVSDHRGIVARIDDLEATDPGDTDRLQELLYGLYALILVHFEKEEGDYLPLFEQRPEEEVASVFERMSGAAGHSH